MKQKLEQLQDLRGIAILMVVLFHSGSSVFPLFAHGNTGVLLFFMVSGFIIAAVHGRDRGPHAFFEFAKKRVARIYFPYLPIAIAFIVLFAVTGKGSQYHHDPINMVRNLLLIQDPDASIHPYAWTLVFEMFYYLAFGAISITFGAGPMIFAVILAAPALLNTALDFYDDRNIIFSTYNLYFAAGVCADKVRARFSGDVSRLVAFIFLAAFVTAPFFIETRLVIFLAAAAFFVMYLSQPSSVKLLNKIGNASYSIYLIHAIVLAIGKSFAPDGMLGVIVLFTLCIASGFLYFSKAESSLTSFGRMILDRGHDSATRRFIGADKRKTRPGL